MRGEQGEESMNKRPLVICLERRSCRAVPGSHVLYSGRMLAEAIHPRRSATCACNTRPGAG